MAEVATILDRRSLRWRLKSINTALGLIGERTMANASAAPCCKFPFRSLTGNPPPGALRSLGGKLFDKQQVRREETVGRKWERWDCWRRRRGRGGRREERHRPPWPRWGGKICDRDIRGGSNEDALEQGLSRGIPSGWRVGAWSNILIMRDKELLLEFVQ
jgi:hypothetical protein